MRSLSLNSYAKLNLYLEVLGKRPDNYHSIFTLFERVSLSDQVRLRRMPKRGIRIVCSGFSLPLGRNNLAYQAASLLQRRFRVRQGVEIKIRKRIPISAGLGGGSSNAATVLSGLNRLWGLNLGVKQLVAIARQIGSDVPFFLYNSSFAVATSRGDEIRVSRLLIKLWHIIVVPRIKVFSSLVYKRWDRSIKVKRLIKYQSMIKMLKAALLKKDFSKLNKLLFNSLEEVSMAVCPLIRKARLALSDLGLEAISMTGSGSAVFGLVSSRKEAYALARQLRKMEDWDVFVARTI